MNHKKGTKKVFCKVFFYKKINKANKLTSANQKKLYLIRSYGILNLSKYLKPGNDTKLQKVVNNASNMYIKKVVEQWK